jgi:exodeoxyribonuclease VII large subunit
VISQVVPVSLLASYIREILDGDRLLADVWVEGEVSNLFPARSGHVYFTLRDEESQLKCVLFRTYAARQRALLSPGDLVAAHGNVSFYEREGTVQLYVDVVQPAGLGLAALQLERLRQQLAAEGLFDPARKRPLPAAPGVIGVVTSPDGAVWHDIQHVLRRRYPLTHLILAPTAVQGDRAPAAIVAALEALQVDGRSEVIILARGGGSAEDLAAFNDEAVVRAVFACRVPVVTGIGHETDHTLVDEAADLRAPTPSAAAELCVPSVVDLRIRLAEHETRLTRAIRQRCESERLRLDHLQTHLRRLDPARTMRTRQALLRELVARGARSQRAALEAARARLALQVGLLRALDPVAVLGRGYAALSDGETGRPLSRVSAATPGIALRADLADGFLLGRVHTIRATAPAPERGQAPNGRRQ